MEDWVMFQLIPAGLDSPTDVKATATLTPETGTADAIESFSPETWSLSSLFWMQTSSNAYWMRNTGR
jgi:hypothetical protein